MKNHLAGFGIIMAVGLAIALVGSNPASSLFATLFTTTTDALAQTTSTTTDIVASSSDSTTAATSTEQTVVPPVNTTVVGVVATTEESTAVSPILPVAIARPSIYGFSNGDIVTGTRNGAVQVFGSPIAVRAEFILPTGEIRPIYPKCPDTATSLYTGTAPGENCYFSIDTMTVPNGSDFKVRGFAKYADGSLLSTEYVTFSIENAVQVNDFMFVSPESYAKVSGYVQIQGRSATAKSVAYAIFDDKAATTPIGTGSTEHIGDLWLHRWDTRTVKNGAYRIEPHVVGQLGKAYKGTSLWLMVYNEPIAIEPVVSTSTNLESMSATTPVVEPVVKTTVEPIVNTNLEPAMRIEAVKVPEPVVDAAPTVEPAQEDGVGFFRNVRDIFRSVIAPQEQPVIEAPKAIVVTSAAVQRLELVVSAVKEAVQEGGEVPQSTINRIAKDTDGDGLPDYQETEAVHTDPAKKDTDGDGIDDGAEMQQGTNPLNADRTVKLQYENAKLLGETVKPDLLKIETVALATTTETVEVEVPTMTASGEVKTIKEKKQVVKEKVKFTGKTLPYALVTIYVYSDIPTIVTVKADKNGSWSYALDKPLDNGQHQAYVTINDSTGKIVAKSQALGFVKTAQAITVANFEELAQASESESAGAVDASKRNFGIIVILVIGIGLLVGILMVVRSFRNSSNTIV